MRPFQNTSFAAFRYREYRIFWLAAAFSNIGIWALIFGRLWLMRTLTDSEITLGLVTLANLGPVMIFSMWGGVVADRVNRLKLIRITRGMFAALALLTGVLIALDAIQPWQIIALALVEGVLLSFDIPSRAAMVATIVPRQHLAGAIALYSIVFGAGAIIGPAFFAPLVGLWGLAGLFFVIAAAYSLTVVSLMFMSTAGHRIESKLVSPWEGLKEGFSYLRGNKPILSITLLGIFGGLVGFSYQTLIPVFTDEVLGGGEETYGRLLLGSGIGGLIATLAIAFTGKRVRPATFLILSGAAFGISLIFFARAETLIVATVAFGLVGATRTVYQIMSQTLVQANVSPEFRGRVLGVNQFTWGASALGGLLMGALAQHFGAPFALTLGGTMVTCAVIAAGATAIRPLWTAEARAAAETARP